MGHNPHPAYRPDIDGLRAIAVLSIVAFHFTPHKMPGGFIGVDVFFVISGFLIGSIVLGGLARGDFSFAEFYARRIRRIFPALVVVLLATWCLAWFLLLPDELKQLGKHIAGASLFVANVIYWQEASNYFDAAAETKPLLHLWSLGVEEQFYIVGPLLAFAAWRFRHNMLVLIAIAAVLSFALNVIRVHADPASTFYLPFTRAWELLLGCALAEATRRRQMPVMSGPMSTTVSGIGLALIAASAAFFNSESAYPGWWALLPTVGAACVITAGPQAWFNKTLLSHRAAVFVGLISYPLYLWHWPLLTVDRIVEGNLPTRFNRAIIVALSFALAALTYLIVERPIRAFRANYAALAFAACCGLVAALGLVTLRADGFGERFPAEIRNLAYYRAAYIDAATQLWRKGQCYLPLEMSADRFTSACIDATPADAPLVFLWGDSHAAALYPGLAELHRQNRIRVAQFTAVNCVPVFTLKIRGRADCAAINDGNLRRIAILHPHTVILHANWRSPFFDWSRFSETISALKPMTKNIVVVGPVPHWSNWLPKLMIKKLRLGQPQPVRLNDGRGSEVSQLEANLANIARANGVTFFSVLDLLCNGPSCLAQIGAVNPDLTSFDGAHITPPTAIFVVQQMLPMLIDAK